MKKLNIIGYKDVKLQQKIGEYSVQINPEKYAQQYTTKFAGKETLDTGGVTNKFIVHQPQDLSLEFYIDATGAVTGTKSGEQVTSVADEIKKLKDVVYSINGNIHSPNYLRLLWGKLTFDCRLQSMNIEYLLFNPEGLPLRAKLTTQFVQYLSAEKARLQDRKSSPDLTHSRTVVAGDTLPLLCFRIYQDSRYYLDIARFNRLNAFRNLAPGQKILFPPLPVPNHLGD